MSTRNLTPSVNELRVCIYEKQKDMIKLFHEEMDKLSKQKTFKRETRWPSLAKVYDKVKSFFTLFKTNSTSKTVDSKKRDRDIKTYNPNNYAIHKIKRMKFKLVSDRKQRIEETKKALQKIIDEDTKTEQIRNDYFPNLNAKEIEEIKSNLDGICEYKIEQHLSRIRITGPQTVINDCIPMIHNLIMKFRSNHMNKAQDTAKNVQWQYQDGTKWISYSLFINDQLETAYANKLKTVDFTDENDEACYVEFDKLVEYNKSDGKPNHVIRRFDLSNIQSQGVPDTWEPNKMCDLIKLDEKSDEYKNVVKLFCPKAQAWMKKILKIERVQNERLYKQYMAHKAYFEQKNNNANEKTLFHGSTSDSIENIWKTGFNRSYAGKNAVAYGKGVYFAKESAYSHNYTSLVMGIGATVVVNTNGLQGHMFVSKVLVGISAVGTSATETKNLPKSNGVTVDTTVDQLQNPSIIVIYHDAQAYPEYLITYQ